jgi:hypothetical protein
MPNSRKLPDNIRHTPLHVPNQDIHKNIKSDASYIDIERIRFYNSSHPFFKSDAMNLLLENDIMNATL